MTEQAMDLKMHEIKEESANYMKALSEVGAKYEESVCESKRLTEIVTRLTQELDSLKVNHANETQELYRDLDKKNLVIDNINLITELVNHKEKEIIKLRDQLQQARQDHQIQLKEIKSLNEKNAQISLNTEMDKVTKTLQNALTTDLKKQQCEHDKEMERLKVDHAETINEFERRSKSNEQQLTNHIKELESELFKVREALKQRDYTVDLKTAEIGILKEVVKKECEERNTLLKQVDRLKTSLPGMSIKK